MEILSNDSVVGSPGTGSALTVWHVLPFDQPRGAQRYARTLVDQLGSETERHLIVTLFRSEQGAREDDLALDVPQGRLRSLGLDPRALWRLRRAIETDPPRLVVAHGGEPAKYLAFALPKSIPMIYLTIGSTHPRLDRRISGWLRNRYTERADVVVSVSRALADQSMADHGIPAEKLVVIPNGRDPSTFHPRTDPSSPDRARLLWIGQLDVTKRPEIFIEIIETLTEDGLNVEGRMIGDGPRRDELTTRAERSGVALLGHRDDVPDLLAGSDLLVFTGAPPEGMPGVLIEAGLAGVAAVTTRVPGADEVVVDGETGLLVDVPDVDGLISGVRALVLDPDKRHRMGRRAREVCVSRFSIETTSDVWRDLITRLVAA